MGSFEVAPIGFVRSTRTAVEDDDWDAVTSRIELDPEHFISHVEVVYLFDRVTTDKIERAARHPRNNREWPPLG